MDATILKEELALYEMKKGELLDKAPGDFVLIGKVAGEVRIVDIFKAREDALKTGYEHFLNKPFLVKQITLASEVLFFPSNLISVN